jgi:hypothetical protein
MQSPASGFVVVVGFGVGVVEPIEFEAPSDEVDFVAALLVLLLLGSRTTIAIAISIASTKPARSTVRLRLCR